MSTRSQTRAVKETTPPYPVDRSEGDVNLSQRRDQWQANAISADTRRILDQDSDAFLHQCLSSPCLNALSACEGIYLEDVDGRRIMDFHGNYVHQVGFRNPRVVAAVKDQLDVLPFCTRRYTNEPAIRLASRLGELAPGNLGKCLFAPSGAVAVGMALKLARLATGRHKTISMWESFHGATLEASSVGGEALFRCDIGPLLPGTIQVPPPGHRQCVFGCGGDCDARCADYIEYVLQQEGDIAALIAEPIRASNVTAGSPMFWKRVADACRRHGTLLIFDEIPTGLGRTGHMFASACTGVTPDMIVLGKGLGGGVMPMAALIARRDLDVGGNKAIGHYTHEKSPLGAAAALATLDCLLGPPDDPAPRDDRSGDLPADASQNLMDRAGVLGHRLRQQLIDFRRSCPVIGDVRGEGLLVGFDVVEPESPHRACPQRAEAVLYAALDEGVSFKTGGGNTVVLAPPLTITDAELDEAVRRICRAVQCVHEGRGS
ncbi:aspartate aminotransferase family protein [Crateriforma conspicua]|nr:aspartate aminotransferase family protein [Crateriforma conspicua]